VVSVAVVSIEEIILVTSGITNKQVKVPKSRW
jgi:hypothetical protein